MLRFVLGLIAAASATAATAQSGASSGAADGCRVRINATPTGWMIQGYDPFGNALPEGTFGATFSNEGGAECRFAPVFALDRPPFGLSRGAGERVTYALLNLTDSQDVTPRAGQTQRRSNQPEMVLAPNESKTLLFRLVADPADIKSSGNYTQDVRLEAQDARFATLGGTRLVLGVDVLPSARLGLAGAYTMNDGQAVVDLGDLNPGVAPVPLQLRVNSTGRYKLNVTSANAGQLRLEGTDWAVPYTLSLGGQPVSLAGGDRVTARADSATREALPIHFSIGSTANRRAGVYRDVISISIAAQ